MKTENSKIFDYSPCLLSGLLLGLSVPRFSAIPLGFLAWFAFVPLFFELKKTEKFAAFAKKIFIAVGLGFGIITIYVVNSSVFGFAASWVLGSIVWSAPFLAFFFLRRLWNWNFALFSLPFVWTLWEWSFHQSEISFGAIRIGGTQAEVIWLIQFVDIFGIDSLTFWVITANLLIFRVFEFFSEAEKFTFIDILNARILVVLTIFVLPICYSVYIFSKPQFPTKEIAIAAVQPNISPFLELTPRNSAAAMNKQIVLTEKALSTGKTDLIVWHEVSVPYVLSTNESANLFLAQKINKFNVPILLGAFETAEGKNFNSAFIVSTEKMVEGRIKVKPEEIYAKRRMIPFIEFVPYADFLPSAESLLIKIGSRPELTAGKEAKTFQFTAKNGETVRGGTLICYENLYPEPAIEAVQNGAEFLANMTNEGWFGQSNGQYQLASFSRIRSIETRREMVRVASTGITWTVDKFGRIKQQVPAWSEQFLTGKIALSDEKTFYVRNPRLFPAICGVGLLIILAGAFLRKLKIFQNKL